MKMRKPANIEAFRELIESMEHRERFVFPLLESLDFYSSTECCSLEVYSTDLHKRLGDRTQNINWCTVCIQGKFDKKYNTKTSQLYRITRDVFLQSMLDLMA
jgi:hypothetical protein